MLETSSFDADDNIVARLENLLEYGLERNIIIDATMAQSIKDAEYFWLIRENLSAAQKDINVSIKNDISIPLVNMHKFIEQANKIMHKIIPQAHIVCFGHVGDGNFHVLLLINMDDENEVKTAEGILQRLAERAIDMDGTCTGEHCIGQGKRKYMAKEHGNAIYFMKAIKQAIDPNNIMNPDKIWY